ncbi:MAG TPA: transglutaminase-like cysteine peptidase [Micavibrio sp.]|nr:transglutaminase-like cysteine peptidase [Micavibrio sp.]
MKFRNSFVSSAMRSVAGHAVIGAAMMGLAATADASEAPPPRGDGNVAQTLPPHEELSKALSEEFFSSSGPAVDTSSYKFLQMGNLVPPLWGQVELCKRLPDTCFRQTKEYVPLRVDAAFMQELTTENIRINKMVTPAGDKDQYGQDDYWNFPDDGKGDCEDYVLAKMKSFHEKFGIPLNNMSLVYVEITPDSKEDVGRHALLALRTSDGDYLFNNLTNDVVFPYQTSYKFVATTTFEDFKTWKDNGSAIYSLIADKDGHPLPNMLAGAPLVNVSVPALRPGKP